MNRMKSIFAVASILLAATFVLSCSSDDGGSVSCELQDGTCTTKFNTNDQCYLAGGNVIQSCPVSSSSSGNNNFIYCEVAGVCAPVQTAELCQQAGGKVVNSCPGGNNFVNCEVMGICSPMLSAEQSVPNVRRYGCSNMPVRLCSKLPNSRYLHGNANCPNMPKLRRHSC